MTTVLSLEVALGVLHTSSTQVINYKVELITNYNMRIVLSILFKGKLCVLFEGRFEAFTNKGVLYQYTLDKHAEWHAPNRPHDLDQVLFARLIY